MDNELQAQSIALNTLKQRCEYLQQRLCALEEENCKLKLEKSQESGINISNTSLNTSSLEKEIILLNHRNSQMSHQIQMINKENQTLWLKLSELVPESVKLEPKLSKYAIQCMWKNCEFRQPISSINVDPTNNMCDKLCNESLEEISLKLINDILMGKTELENQYSQMIDLQKDNTVTDLKNISFLMTQLESSSAVHKMKIYVQNLKEFLKKLYQQKNELSSAIINIKNLKSTSTSCGNVNSSSDLLKNNMNLPNSDRNNAFNEHETNSSSVDEVGKSVGENGDSKFEQLCPMCGQIFIGSFTDFYQHVSDHFEDENEEFVDASATFEVVP